MMASNFTDRHTLAIMNCQEAIRSVSDSGSSSLLPFWQLPVSHWTMRFP